MLLVTADPCALEVLRGAYARSVLKPPATYVISSVGKLNNNISKYLNFKIHDKSGRLSDFFFLFYLFLFFVVRLCFMNAKNHSKIIGKNVENEK